MATIVEALETLASHGWWKEWHDPALKQFLLSGDEKLLTKLAKFNEYSWLPPALLAALPGPNQLDEHGKRFLQACAAAGHPQAIGNWLQQCTRLEGGGSEAFTSGCALLLGLGCTKSFLAQQVAEQVRPFITPAQLPTAAGEFLLALSDSLVLELLRRIERSTYVVDVAALFVANAPERWKQVLGGLKFPHLNPEVWVVALAAAPREFLELAARAFAEAERWNARFTIGTKLHEIEPVRFDAAVSELATRQLLSKDTDSNARLWGQAQQSASWLLSNHGQEAVPLLTQYFAAALGPAQGDWQTQSTFKSEVLEQAVQKLGREALPLLEACFATEQPEVQLKALQLWSKLKTSADMHSIARKLAHLFASKESSAVARALRVAGELGPEAVEAELWPLLGHKSRPVRDAAASVLAKLGDSRLPKAQEIWAIRRADTRIAAVAWLRALGTEAAAGVLKSRLEEEEDDNLRDAILLALEHLQGAATLMSPAELRERIQKTLKKLSGPPVTWLDPKTLPACELQDGSKLPPDWLLYLLYRQSRVKEMRPDIEAKPLYTQIDRKTSGELALAALRAFFGSEADADERWVMAFAAIVGDDRLVPAFTHQIREWADSMRGKLAEYAAQALALLGTDAALLAVDALAIRYRSKNKNIGKAASEAFAEAAHARGLTVEELGDLVVPWFGFQPGQPRLIEAGKAKLEAQLGSDFKLSFRDAVTKKKVAKLPDSASAEVKAEFKEIAAGLKEAVKSQLLRMETLMVRQFRWPVARWQELYLQHPLLLPFAQRLVWGAYANGKLVSTFRALEDHSLTDAADEAYSLPPEGQVGVVHPLELSPEARQAWLRHLADYDVVPPFAQLERPVITVTPAQAKTRFGNEVADTELNAMTFKGRAERLGWTRGSVCDAGGIPYYVKTFPGAGVDVFVGTEGMYIGVDMYTNIKLGKMFFVKHASVQIGSYIYDEPGDQNDPRLVSFGEVPAIAFSEAMGDLVKIAGKSNEQPAEGSNA